MVQPEEFTQHGIDDLKGIVESGKVLRLKEPRVINGLMPYYHFEISAFSKTWDLALTRQALTELPQTEQHRKAALQLARALDSRFRNPSPYLFITGAARLLHIEPIWPPTMYAGFTVPAMPVTIIDQETHEKAQCLVEFAFNYGVLRRNSFELVEDIVNTIRMAIDSDEISFAPTKPQVVQLAADARVPAPPSADEFVQRKVWKLGFSAGADPRHPVWLPDPWDLAYFGLTKSAVQQRAAVLAAQNKIELLPDEPEFARVGTALLAQDGPEKKSVAVSSSGETAEGEFETALEVYSRVSSLGEGGAGRVLKVMDSDGEEFALKHLKPESLTERRSKRFRNEMRFCASVAQRNIIQVLDWGITVVNNVAVPFYVMPLYAETLRWTMSSGLEPEQALDIFEQVLDGVKEGHDKDVWHRDLKPENILYDPATRRAVVSDFGIAHFAEPLLHTLIHTNRQDRMANFKYAAPEQREDNATVDHRADIYSLGVILYEMFTGRLLQGIGHAPIAATQPEYAFLDPIVNKMAAQAPESRYQSVLEVRQVLAAGRTKG